MAFNVSGLSEFTEKAKNLLLEGLLFNDSYANFSTQTGIKHKEYLNYLESDVELQAGVCDLSVSGGTTLTEKTVQVHPMSIFQKWCLSDLDQKDNFQETGTGKGKWNTDLKTAIVTDVIRNAKFKLDKTIFEGKTSSGDLFDGLVTQFLADSDVIDVTSSSAVTVDNIDDYVSEMILSVPQDMFSRGMLTIHMSVKNFNLYRQNRINANLYHLDPSNTNLLTMPVFGWENMVNIKAEPGMTGDDAHMFLTFDQNIVMLYDEVNEVANGEMFFRQLDRNVYFTAQWKIGVSYYFGSEVVLFTVS